jgi:hypothetical protein
MIARPTSRWSATLAVDARDAARDNEEDMSFRDLQWLFPIVTTLHNARHLNMGSLVCTHAVGDALQRRPDL